VFIGVNRWLRNSPNPSKFSPMRALADPEVLKKSIAAAAVSALACLPRLHAWETRRYPVWYLESVLFLGSIVFWAFVFGWHTKYSGRPLFTLCPDRFAFGIATAAGVLGAVTQHYLFDPTLKARAPEDFPTTFGQWMIMILFILTFIDLLVVFAPFDWLMRLSHSTRVATGLTIVFGMFVVWLKQRTVHERLSPSFLAMLLCSQALAGLLSVFFYLRGGILLVWWCHLLIHSRHFWHLGQ
jgi:hypothetical protein